MTHTVEEFTCPDCTGLIFMDWNDRKQVEAERTVDCPSCAHDTVAYKTDDAGNLLGVSHGSGGWRGLLTRGKGVRRISRDVDSKTPITVEPPEDVATLTPTMEV